jgi:hypothetical protein
VKNTQKLTGYLVVYVADGSSTVRRFRSKEERAVWVSEFLLENQGRDDFWVDGLIDGSFTVIPSSGMTLVTGKAAA